MDEQSFDDFLKDRLGRYEDPTFDEAAWGDLQSRLAAFPATPWYVRYGTPLKMAGIAASFTLINAWMIWTGVYSQSTTADQSAIVKSQTEVIDSLSSVIGNLQSNYNGLNQNYQALRDLHDSESIGTTNSISSQGDLVATRSKPGVSSEIPEGALGRSEDFDEEVLTKLVAADKLTIKDGHVFVVDQSNQREKRIVVESKLWPTPELQLSNHFIVMHDPAKTPRKEREISVSMRNQLDKHYFSGIGIQVGGHVDILNSFLKGSTGLPSLRTGVAANWVISPRLSVETGADFATLRYAKTNDYQNLPVSPHDNFGSTNDIERAKVTTFLVAAPVGVRYRQWISNKSQAFVKVGYTPYWSFGNICETESRLKLASPFDQDVRNVVIKQKRIEEPSYYGGTATLAIGIVKNVTKKSKLEASAYYETSLGNVGPERARLQTAGIRGAWWLNAR